MRPVLVSQVDMFNAFKPVITFEAPGPGKSQWKSRLVAGLAMIGTFYVLYSHTPGKIFDMGSAQSLIYR